MKFNLSMSFLVMVFMIWSNDCRNRYTLFQGACLVWVEHLLANSQVSVRAVAAGRVKCNLRTDTMTVHDPSHATLPDYLFSNTCSETSLNFRWNAIRGRPLYYYSYPRPDMGQWYNDLQVSTCMSVYQMTSAACEPQWSCFEVFSIHGLSELMSACFLPGITSTMRRSGAESWSHFAVWPRSPCAASSNESLQEQGTTNTTSVSKGSTWGFLKWRYPQIMHFYGIFPYKPSS